MDEHVTTGQAIIILTTTRLALAVSTMPTINLPPYNQDLWFMNIVSIFYTILMFLPLLFLANRFNNFSMTGYLRIIYGKKLGAVLIILYGLYFLMNSINGLTVLTELTTSTILVQEMNINIIIFSTIVMFYIISKGIVASARGYQLLAPIAMGITVILMILGLPNVDFTFMKPILKDSSFIDINKGALLLSTYFADIFIILMIVPELKEKKHLSKIVIVSVIISISFLAVIVLLTQGSLGIEQTRHSNASFLLYVRLIDAFNFFERIDSVFVTSWLITSMARNAGFLYICTRVFRELFNKKEEDKLIPLITSLALGIISYDIVNNRSVIGVRRNFDMIYSSLFVIFVLVIPIITCIVYYFRRKTLKASEPSEKLLDK